MQTEIQVKFKEIDNGLSILKKHFNWEQSLNRTKELDELIETENFWRDSSKAQAIMREKKQIEKINSELGELRAGYYKTNLKYKSQKAEIDVLKFELESANLKGGNESELVRKEYGEKSAVFGEVKLEKEEFEIKISRLEKQIKALKSEVKAAQDERDRVLKKVDLAQNKLNLLDRSEMSFMNKIGDIVRDLPILDFMDPYYKVKQTVVKDVLYDVNFAAMPAVDRCTSCHLGIANPDFKDAEQPYTTHPDLDLYLTSKSPHPEESFGCTSCHTGRSRGTSFLSSAHTPNTPEQKKEWKEKYDWKPVKHWLQPMLPTRYTQASCFKCHQNTSDLAGAEKINLGLTLIDRSGCNGCHVSANWESKGKSGPDLRKLNEKSHPEWVAKWIKNPRAFRYNTRMPHVFEQANQEKPNVAKRNVTEIAITIPIIPNKLPCLDVSGEDNPRNASMNNTPETK